MITIYTGWRPRFDSRLKHSYGHLLVMPWQADEEPLPMMVCARGKEDLLPSLMYELPSHRGPLLGQVAEGDEILIDGAHYWLVRPRGALVFTGTPYPVLAVRCGRCERLDLLGIRLCGSCEEAMEAEAGGGSPNCRS
ncbi:hypothetical protein QMZ92_30590 [Streptomyces sp. HNM0645]|uniref:hypothetical protein n=1 Tax=Streptomyces sp. HNM0645 TaxID=2782343 RepID=UPI0024B7690D|nr:hypothetical protein [Streptomyces sp. HNM0645]MDI9888596.1 hypothetical protein [Streptomyces sp. HNM0645]